MEIITTSFFIYLSILTSWWWITLAAVTIFGTLVFVLRDQDYTLPKVRALLLCSVGLLGLVPGINWLLPSAVRTDFVIRWEAADASSFPIFALTLIVVAVLLAPVAFLAFFGLSALDYFSSTAFGHDVCRHGLKRAIKLNLNLKG